LQFRALAASRLDVTEKLAEEKTTRRKQVDQEIPRVRYISRGHEFGTREFFDAVERHRYTEYAPGCLSLWASQSFAAHVCSRWVAAWERTFCSCPRRRTGHGVDLTSRSIQISRQHFAVYE